MEVTEKKNRHVAQGLSYGSHGRIRYSTMPFRLVFIAQSSPSVPPPPPPPEFVVGHLKLTKDF